MLKIGQLKDGTDVYISEESPNRHISVLGISGSGKTVRLRELIKNVVENRETALIFDINGMDYKDCIDNVNVISAREGGFNASLLESGADDEESKICHVMSIAQVLSRVFGFGSKQEEALRNAILYAVSHKEDNESELAIIRTGLLAQETAVAQAVESRLWEFLNMDIVRNNSLGIRTGYANVISLEGLSFNLQRVWVELLLVLLWRKLRTGNLLLNNLWIFIDEFQNLSLKKDSVLLEMLREARKYGVNIVLATQSVTGYGNDVKAALDQTAVHLYFQQGLTDVKKVASLIDVNKKGLWESKLKSLRVGESVAVGCLSVRGKNVKNPIIIKSDFKMFNDRKGQGGCYEEIRKKEN